ncbi:hypothetical protein [Ligilactobacillus acidipiscis]|uniref:Uncharacterized protein n=1 Tax=Ligilactobacillus acidipiscis TaxID=89059 RepID=A0A0R2KFJ7_9LACO|nr:hypothetical protein [Ligilactobacillus acidipiscis]KRN88159.1 hypothetical protein IV43_GL000005 [Ligilactobacillus acidipiscis]
MFSKGKMQNISGIIDRIYSGEDGRSQEIIVNGRRVLLKSDQNAHDKRFIFSGVFTVNESEKNDYDAYIFCVKAKLPEVFIFSGDSYLTLVDTNKTEEYQPYILAVLKKDHWSTIKTIKK